MAEVEPQGVPLEGVEWGPAEAEALGDGQLLARVASLGQELHHKAIDAGVPFGSPIWIAATLLHQAVQSLLAGGRCNLAAPPSDIQIKVNDAGAMIHRCGHDPAHEWSLDGTKL